MRLLMSLAAAFGIGATASTAAAQATLSLGATTIAVPEPGATEYDATQTVTAQMPFQVTGCPGTGTGCTITIWATTSSLGNGKSVSEVQWQLNGTAPNMWLTLSTIPSNVAVVAPAGTASGVIYFRVRLSWSRDLADRLYSAGIRLAVKQN